jgi:hypothetical protein
MGLEERSQIINFRTGDFSRSLTVFGSSGMFFFASFGVSKRSMKGRAYANAPNDINKSIIPIFQLSSFQMSSADT